METVKMGYYYTKSGFGFGKDFSQNYQLCRRRSVETFKQLWDGISDEIKWKAIFYTDRWDAYNLIPYKRRIIRKGGTNRRKIYFSR